MSSTGKRSRNVLSIKTKIEIISRLENGEKAASLAKIYNVGKATISDIKLKKEAILNFAAKWNGEDGSSKRKTMKKPQDEQLEAAVYSWFVQRRKEGLPVTGPLLCEKALEFNNQLAGSPDFKASNGWLKNFKSRHGIRGAELQGKSLPDEGTTVGENKETYSTVHVNIEGNYYHLPIATRGYQGLPLQQNEGVITSELVPSTSTAPCETVVTDESMEREDLTPIKYEEVFVSEDEEKEVSASFHDYTPTAMTDVTDISVDIEDPLPTVNTREIPKPKTETVTNPAEVYSVRHERDEVPSSVNSAPDVNELFAKYLVAELRSLRPDDAALLRKKIHCLVADFMVYETGSRAANVQEPRVSGSERRS